MFDDSKKLTETVRDILFEEAIKIILGKKVIIVVVQMVN